MSQRRSARRVSPTATLDVPLGKPDDLYIDFIMGLFTPPAIGGNLLGLQNFEDYRRRAPAGAQMIVVASNGPYDYLGSKYYREADGHRFDRLRVRARWEIISFRAERLSGSGNQPVIR